MVYIFLNLGVNDIKKHRFFNNINFTNLLNKKIDATFKPIVKSPNDTSNFSVNSDSESELNCPLPSDDPFKDWN